MVIDDGLLSLYWQFLSSVHLDVHLFSWIKNLILGHCLHGGCLKQCRREEQSSRKLSEAMWEERDHLRNSYLN